MVDIGCFFYILSTLILVFYGSKVHAFDQKSDIHVVLSTFLKLKMRVKLHFNTDEMQNNTIFFESTQFPHCYVRILPKLEMPLNKKTSPIIVICNFHISLACTKCDESSPGATCGNVSFHLIVIKYAKYARGSQNISSAPECYKYRRPWGSQILSCIL